jgi:hypothetical protein
MINCCSVENSIRTESAQPLARTFPGDLIATYNLAFPREEPPRVVDILFSCTRMPYCCDCGNWGQEYASRSVWIDDELQENSREFVSPPLRERTDFGKSRKVIWAEDQVIIDR